MWIRVWGLIEKDGIYIVWRVRWVEEEKGTYGASGVFFVVVGVVVFFFFFLWCRGVFVVGAGVLSHGGCGGGLGRP